ncbi:unnamed protein product [Microthlaspi erraticum]|uniref:Cyclin-like domain-containing protein n=1 Tax=Microthlaspi erraticum TaxID=1685480 RepID=A0A6D2JPX8_9BRAS|nr:unnamed protein product [Microthlaspi erraticum]
MGKVKVPSRNAKRQVEARPLSGKKARSATFSRRKKAQISPAVLRSSLKRQKQGISDDSVVVSSSSCFLDVSCGSSRVEKSPYSRKRRINEVRISGPVVDAKDAIGSQKFRRITRSYSKLEKEREREEIEFSKSSCVASDSVDGSSSRKLASNNENDEVSLTRSDVTFADHFADSRNLNLEMESDVFSADSRVECCSSTKFGSVTGGFVNEGVEISKPISFPEADFTLESAKEEKPELEIAGCVSNLACTEQFSIKHVSDYSDLDSSEYTPSIFFESGSEFSEKSECDSTPSLTHSLFLEFKMQFRKSTIPNDLKPSLVDFRPELRSFEDEEVEESYQRLRERERNHAYPYIQGMDQRNLIPHLRLISVQWIVNECITMELQNETLFLGVSLLDRFLNKGSFKSPRSILVVGIACLALATRIEENQYVNTVQKRKFYIQGQKFSRSEVVAMEWLVQEVLRFRCFSPTIYNFLWFYLKAAEANPRVENKAKTLAIMALSDHSTLRYSPSTLAATLVILACLQYNEHEAHRRVIEVHVRTKDNSLAECVQSLEWLLGQ